MTAISNFLKPQDYVNAGSSAKYTCTIADLNGLSIGTGTVSAMTLSLIDTASGAVVNAVSKVDIFNTGRGTLDVLGNCTITLTAADTALFVTTDTFEVRSLIIDFAFGSNTGRHRVDIGILGVPGTQPN